MQRQRKTTEWERLEIISRKLEIPREHFMQDRHNKGQKQQGPNRSRRYKKRWQDTQNNRTKKIFTTQIITMV